MCCAEGTKGPGERPVESNPLWGLERWFGERLGRALVSTAGVFALRFLHLLDVKPDSLGEIPHGGCSEYDRHAFAAEYLLHHLLRKSPNIPGRSDEERKSSALSSFFTSEEDCRSINRQFAGGWVPKLEGHPWFFSRVREHVQEIMGPLQTSRSVNTVKPLERIAQLMKHGNGAAVGITSREASLPLKFGTQPVTVSPRLHPYAKTIMGEHWYNKVVAQSRLVINPHSVWACVPKSFKTFRGIDIQAGLNVYAQLGVGRYLKERLMRFGCDLKEGWRRNNRLASLAAERLLATIDLKAASDSISYGLVKALVSEEWFTLLELLRHDMTEIDGIGPVRLEKFSAMGCGFTFELESIIFLAIARSIVPKSEWSNIAVFGDDIIVPQKHAHELLKGLELLGFKANAEKSFLGGNFFESCGGHYYTEPSGKVCDVTPFSLTGASPGVPYLLTMANHLRLWMDRTGCVNAELIELWRECTNGLVPTWANTAVPPQFGVNCGVIRGRFDGDFVGPRSNSLAKRSSAQINEFGTKRPEIEASWDGRWARAVSMKLKTRKLATTAERRGFLLAHLATAEQGMEPIHRLLQDWDLHGTSSRLALLPDDLTGLALGFNTRGQATYGQVPIKGLYGKAKRIWSFVGNDWPDVVAFID